MISKIQVLSPVRRAWHRKTAASVGRSRKAFAELRVGMRVADDLTAIDGIVILAAETILTAPLINLLSDPKDLIAGAAVSPYDQSLDPEARL